MSNAVLGRLGEDFAASVLEEKGYAIEARNFRCKFGEIDLIAEKDGILCFIEVKTRQSLRYGLPAEAVTQEKQRRMRKSARVYLGERERRYRGLEFHVMEIYLNHIPRAF